MSAEQVDMRVAKFDVVFRRDANAPRRDTSGIGWRVLPSIFGRVPAKPIERVVPLNRNRSDRSHSSGARSLYALPNAGNPHQPNT